MSAADELIRRVDPEVVRVVWPHQRTAGYGVGPRKMSEHYAYLARPTTGTSTWAATTAPAWTTAGCWKGPVRTCAS